MLKQFIVTPAMGKRLIAKGLADDVRIQGALSGHTIVIVAGTTNGYVAEEILAAIGQGEGFSRLGFRRGIVTAPGTPAPQAQLAGDVIISNGTWIRGKTIFDVADQLGAGDVILKGANALDAQLGRAAIQIADPHGGTTAAALRAVIGRRVRLIVPVGLEKRVVDDLDDLTAEVNAPDAEGPRLWTIPGEVYTELDAIKGLTGAAARLLAAGGVYGAEGALWLAVSGDPTQLEAANKLIASLAAEPPCQA